MQVQSYVDKDLVGWSWRVDLEGSNETLARGHQCPSETTARVLADQVALIYSRFPDFVTQAKAAGFPLTDDFGNPL